MDYFIIAMIVGAAGWAEWRLRGVELRFSAQPTEQRTTQPAPVADQFPCYYCGHLYPTAQREPIGQYDYCPAHGSRRKASWLALYRKEATHDNRARVHPADRRSEQPDNDKLPWVS